MLILEGLQWFGAICAVMVIGGLTLMAIVEGD